MKVLFLKLFALFSILISFSVLSQNVIKLDEFKTHRRISLYLGKNDVSLEVKNNSLVIKTLDLNVFEHLANELKKESFLDKIADEITSNTAKYPENAAEITIKIKDGYEIFNFYKEIEKKYIVDIWEQSNKLANEKKNTKKVVSSKKINLKKNIEIPVTNKNENTIQKLDQIPLYTKKDERDFRYGAPLILEYPPMIPETIKTIDVRSKAADYLYKIEDTDFNKDEAEAHAQLTINLFREGNFGLMSKSIDLYKEKYGEDSKEELFNFLKATSIIREAILKNEIDKETGDHKLAYAMYEEIAEKTKEYPLKKAIYHYLIEQKILAESFVESLSLGKRLYVEAKVNFDKEEERFAIERILYSLAFLSQTDDIEKLLKDESVGFVLPKQLQQAYMIYGLIKKKDYKAVIRVYEDKKVIIAKPVDASLLFNVAESYFQDGEYEKAIKIFDDFVSLYSQKRDSTYARIRIATSYDLLGAPVSKVAELYKEVINKSWINEVSYEAKIRYVATIINRKKEISPDDDLIIEYLNRKESDKNVLNNEDMKRLLWLVRLRVFINRKQYNQALLYLKSIPLTSMTPLIQNIFLADAAEIIHGMIKDAYVEGDYGKIIKLWQKHKAEYFDKLPLNLSASFMVCYSYLQLGLFSSSNEIITRLQTYEGPYKNFPNWVESIEVKSTKQLIAEINLLKDLKESNWDDALSQLLKIEKEIPSFDKLEFYLAKVYYHLDDFDKTIEVVESFLIGNKEARLHFSHLEIYEFFTYYLESIYKKDQDIKFIKSAKAVIDDISKTNEKTKYLDELKERTLYLLVEVLDKNNVRDDNYKKYIDNFINEFPKSFYRGRMKYLLGKYFVETKNVNEGEKIFGEIIKDNEIPIYIKELAKSELSTLKIERQSI